MSRSADEASRDEQQQEEEAEEQEAGLPPYLESPAGEEEKLQAIRIAAVRALFRQTGSASAGAVLEDRRMQQFCGSMSERQLNSVLACFPDNFMISEEGGVDKMIALLSIDVDDMSMLAGAAERGLLHGANIRKQKAFKQKAPSPEGEGAPPRDFIPVPISASERFQEHLHDVISNALWQSVAAVSALERTWSPAQMQTKVGKFVFKAANDPELQSMPWKEAVKELVSNAMGCYSASCGEMPWFYELDLVPTLCAAANTVIQNCSNRRQLQETVTLEFEDFLDRALLTKGFWEAVNATFGDEDDKTKAKIFRGLSTTYWPCFDEVFMDQHSNELRNVESFARKWINESMNRAWVSMDSPESTLTQATVSQLFLCCVAPFGQDHPYSCIPFALCSSIGIPPPDWQFIHVAATELFHQWQEGNQKKKRKTGAASYDEPAQPPPIQPAKVKPQDNGKQVFKPGSNQGSNYERRGRGSVAQAQCEAGRGHPECTSQEDCIGGPQSRLVRHRLSSREEGDIYCEPCWCTFVRRNPQLQGDFLN